MKANAATPWKMVVVDDSSIIRNRIVRLIESGRISGFSVAGVARNGREALLLCHDQRPQLVTMDLTMPEMDGIECTENLVRLLPEVMILVVSALSDKATALKALHRGAHGFVCKPFTDEQLAVALNELMGGSA